ncbi:MAG: deoxyribodipyrimidine photo-lyase [Candidatus Omnitrophica bacterium]|nr:deoxyribodipyrimidine photo-lyase [Candidatus Omnitrophota bacterium]
MPKYNISIVIFRRDLRLEDNTALLEALEHSRAVLPVFIFDPRQLKKHEYFSQPGFQFMIQSLRELDAALRIRGGRLFTFAGDPQVILQKLINDLSVDAVFVNEDYTPFSINRDLSLAHLCQSKNVAFISRMDALLIDPRGIKKNDGGVYTVFTPFYNKAVTFDISLPRKNNDKNFFNQTVGFADEGLLQAYLPAENKDITITGGRASALKVLKRIKDFKNYQDIRDYPSIEGTTHLSAHHKFGTVSIREVFHKMTESLGRQHPLVRQLYWRDFFTHIGFHYPYVLGEAFQEKYQNIPWEDRPEAFQAWREGRTGFPIVDAGMRELNTTGYMHNRLRMITASFIVKDLQVDWRLGEKYFATKLVDYDPLVNNGSWQWAASTGCDAQPYFRIFNPWLQQAKFDPDAVYIKRWIPEIKDIVSNDLHHYYKRTEPFPNYPLPIVDHKEATALTKRLFKVHTP